MIKWLPIFLICLLFSFCGEISNRVDLEPVKDIPMQIENSGELDPMADSRAIKGGSFTVWGSAFPKSLNSWLDNNHVSGEIMGLLFEPLVTLHTKENRPIGVLASSWKISKDNKTFTFRIHPKAVWSDGREITAADFQFYYDVIMNKKHLTPVFRVYLKRLSRPVIINEKTLKITAKVNHWSNFWTAAGLTAFPKHIWQGKDFNKINFKFPVVSGPYRLKELKKNRYSLLQRRADWWGRIKIFNQYKYNFDYIRHRFINDRNKTLEAFKKGTFDSYAIYTSSLWIKKTHFEQVRKKWVIRQRIYNRAAKGFQGFALNLRRPIFQDKRVREALCHLLNREKMNEKFMYNAYFLLNSHYPDLYPGNKNPTVPLREFNPAKARALLKKAGWRVDKTGILKKDGKTFTVRLLTSMVDKRHLELYVSDLSAVGIDARIEYTSLPTIRKRLDDHDFDMFWRSQGAGRLRDPEAAWHSSTAGQKASNNIAGVRDAVIDRLIEKQKTEFNLNRRNAILRLIDRRLYDIIPDVLLWQADHTRILYWNRYGTPKNVLDKFNHEDAALVYWWLDPEKDAALKKAMKENQRLPGEMADIHYKEI